MLCDLLATATLASYCNSTSQTYEIERAVHNLHGVVSPMANTTWKMPLSFVDCHSHCEGKKKKSENTVSEYKVQSARHGRLRHTGKLCVMCVLTSSAARPLRGFRCVRLETRGTVSWHRGVSAACTSCTAAFSQVFEALDWKVWRHTSCRAYFIFLSDLFCVFGGSGGGALFTVFFKTQICVSSLLLFPI